MDLRLDEHAFARRLAGYICGSRLDTEEMMRLVRPRAPYSRRSPQLTYYFGLADP